MSARERRAPAPLEHREARAGDARAALEVDDAERGAEIPVRQRLEVEGARLAVAPHLDVVGRALADRHRLVRQVGQREQRLVPLILRRVELNAELLDLLGARAVRLLDLRRVASQPLGPRDLVARRVLLPLQPLELGDQPPAGGFERGDLFERLVRVEAAAAQERPNRLDVVADIAGIEHAAIVYSRPGRVLCYDSRRGRVL